MIFVWLWWVWYISCRVPSELKIEDIAVVDSRSEWRWCGHFL